VSGGTENQRGATFRAGCINNVSIDGFYYHFQGCGYFIVCGI